MTGARLQNPEASLRKAQVPASLPHRESLTHIHGPALVNAARRERGQALAERLERYMTSHRPVPPLFPHQMGILEALSTHYRCGDLVGYIRCAPRAGKTRVAAELLTAVLNPAAGEKALVTAPSRTVRDYWKRELSQWAPELSVGGLKEKGRDITVATYQGLVSALQRGNLSLGEFSAYIPDECHRSLTPRRAAIVEHFKRDGTCVGLTGTPFFSVRKNCDLTFEHQFFNLPLSEAMLAGIVLPCEYSVHETGIDLTDVPDYGPDFDREMLAARVRNSGLFPLAVRTYKTLDAGQPTIMFVGLTSQADQLAEACQAAGIRAGTVHSKNPASSEILTRFERGKLDVLIAVRTIAEGFNSFRASRVYNVTPTMSLPLQEQRSSRALTPDPANPNKSPAVRDFLFSDARARQVLFGELVTGEALAFGASRSQSVSPHSHRARETEGRAEFLDTRSLRFTLVDTAAGAQALVAQQRAKRGVLQVPVGFISIDQAAEQLLVPQRAIIGYIREAVRQRTPEQYGELVVARHLAPALLSEMKGFFERFTPPRGWSNVSDLDLPGTEKRALISSLGEDRELLLHCLTPEGMRWFMAPRLKFILRSRERGRASRDLPALQEELNRVGVGRVVRECCADTLPNSALFSHSNPALVGKVLELTGDLGRHVVLRYIPRVRKIAPGWVPLELVRREGFSSGLAPRVVTESVLAQSAGIDDMRILRTRERASLLLRVQPHPRLSCPLEIVENPLRTTEWISRPEIARLTGLSEEGVGNLIELLNDTAQDLSLPPAPEFPMLHRRSLPALFALYNREKVTRFSGRLSRAEKGVLLDRAHSMPFLFALSRILTLPSRSNYTFSGGKKFPPCVTRGDSRWHGPLLLVGDPKEALEHRVRKYDLSLPSAEGSTYYDGFLRLSAILRGPQLRGEKAPLAHIPDESGISQLSSIASWSEESLSTDEVRILESALLSRVLIANPLDNPCPCPIIKPLKRRAQTNGTVRSPGYRILFSPEHANTIKTALATPYSDEKVRVSRARRAAQDDD